VAFTFYFLAFGHSSFFNEFGCDVVAPGGESFSWTPPTAFFFFAAAKFALPEDAVFNLALDYISVTLSCAKQPTTLPSFIKLIFD